MRVSHSGQRTRYSDQAMGLASEGLVFHSRQGQVVIYITSVGSRPAERTTQVHVLSVPRRFCIGSKAASGVKRVEVKNEWK